LNGANKQKNRIGDANKIIDIDSSAVVEAIVQLTETPLQIQNIVGVNLEAAANILLDKFCRGNVQNGNNNLRAFLFPDGKYFPHVLGLYSVILSFFK
jgi:hypothetical protein